MAGEISTAGIGIKYAVEATAHVRPTTGYSAKASGATLNIADFVTGISGLGAEWEQYDVTPLSAKKRHSFVRGLMSNDGNITFNVNVNPTSREDWGKIVSEFATASASSLGMWFEVTFDGDAQSCFFRGEPCEMNFPDVESAQAVQGTVQIIENDWTGWASKST
jgi:hypothetical protein